MQRNSTHFHNLYNGLYFPCRVPTLALITFSINNLGAFMTAKCSIQPVKLNIACICKKIQLTAKVLDLFIEFF